MSSKFAWISLAAALLAALWFAGRADHGDTRAEGPPEQELRAAGEGAAQDRKQGGELPDVDGDGSLSMVPPRPLVSGSGSGRGSYLPSELTLLREGNLSVDAVGELIYEPSFNDLLHSLANESALDPAAQDLGERYRTGIASSLAGEDDIRLTGLECGLTLCVGVIRTQGGGGAAQYKAWRSSLGSNGALPIYSLLDGEIQGTDGIEWRFFFSADPAANALTTKW